MFCYKTALTLMSLAVLNASAAATKTFALRGLQAATSSMAGRMCNAVSPWEREGGREKGSGAGISKKEQQDLVFQSTSSHADTLCLIPFIHSPLCIRPNWMPTSTRC